MKFTVNQKVDFSEITQKIKTQFPDYTFRDKRKNTFIVGKDKKTGVVVMLRSRGSKLHIVGRIPSKGGFALYILLAILLGGVGAVILFIIFIQPKNEVIEKEIAEFLCQEYDLTKDKATFW